METFERNYESPVSCEAGEIYGKVFSFDDECVAEGMKETIPKGTRSKCF